MITDIDHVQIAMPAAQEEIAREFYGAILNLPEIEKPEGLKSRGGVWFAIGQRQLHLGVQVDFKPARKAHPAFLVDDIKILRAKLLSEGYDVIEDDLLPGHERFYTSDPFGNRLEFLYKL